MIGEKMKQLRKNDNKTLEELASVLNRLYPDTVNFNKGKLSKWENNKEEPKLSSIRILADYYKISIDEFYSTNLTNLTNSNNSLDSIYNKLDEARQDKVYSFAKKLLEEQNKVVEFQPVDDFGTLAAHSADPNKTFDDDEIDKINSYLDKLDEEYDSKHNE